MAQKTITSSYGRSHSSLQLAKQSIICNTILTWPIPNSIIESTNNTKPPHTNSPRHTRKTSIAKIRNRNGPHNRSQQDQKTLQHQKWSWRGHATLSHCIFTFTVLLSTWTWKSKTVNFFVNVLSQAAWKRFLKKWTLCLRKKHIHFWTSEITLTMHDYVMH